MAAIAKRAAVFALQKAISKEIQAGHKIQVQKGEVLLNILPMATKVEVPSISPACLKLESYLRMTSIPHKVTRSLQFSTKGQVPWITYNERNISDSNFIIKFLNDEFNVDLNRGLTEEKKAIAHSLQVMVEQNTYWSMLYWRWVVRPDERRTWLSFYIARPAFVGDFLFYGFQKILKKYLHGQGMGRHSMNEILQITKNDFQAVSEYLGEKPFMMGQEPTLVDASVFGLMANLLRQDIDSPHCSMLQNEFRNIVAYCERMKERFWPDWKAVLAERNPK